MHFVFRRIIEYMHSCRRLSLDPGIIRSYLYGDNSYSTESHFRRSQLPIAILSGWLGGSSGLNGGQAEVSAIIRLAADYNYGDRTYDASVCRQYTII